MLALLEERLERDGVGNVTPVLGCPTTRGCRPGRSTWRCSWTSTTSSKAPQPMLRRLRDALKPDGGVVLVEYRKEDRSLPILPEHKMSVAEAKLEVEAEGFTLWAVNPRLPRQHLLIFRKR
jgi:hypothetical protein